MALRNQEIGARLRELRGERPQTAIADELGVAERTYQNWEAGDAKPAYRNLQRLAEFYGVGEEFILTGDGSPTPDMFPPATPTYPAEALEGALAEVLADIKAQLAEQTQVLSEIKGYAERVEAMLQEQRDLKVETDEVQRLARELIAGREEDRRDSQQVPPPPAVARKKWAAKSRTPSRP